ncbi:Uncharacterised protein [Nocardia otitidiscaviarum]|uniref:Uncharacterized protein n=1 Tax=Nocardia otitidiscaviarum TaxID=1823 RepID=A0A379JGB7_9NOCA|nr:hypothetical protein [Nocardia otitidiscaviarum]MBF6236539.1 hypothetical protein [Nocardia otitidiscaviarum]SUD47500.1 Uncharacterised protein [Nocardia otitidiscaviarum]
MREIVLRSFLTLGSLSRLAGVVTAVASIAADERASRSTHRDGRTGAGGGTLCGHW